MRPLTKSRFKLALDCPTKLYYVGKNEYENQQEEDSFLEALAEGGYQVGELAKCYYSDGHDIPEHGYKIPLEKTAEYTQYFEIGNSQLVTYKFDISQTKQLKKLLDRYISASLKDCSL